MKKFMLISVLVVLFLISTGCKGITINVYNTSDVEEIEEKENNKVSDIDNQSVDEEVIEDSNSISDKIKDKYDSAKSWYDENKDELNEKSKEILEEDVNNINEVVDKVKSWFNYNKQQIKDINNEIISNDKDLIKNIFKNNV